MNMQRVVEILKTEKECVLRNDKDQCDRACEVCDLLLDTEEVLQAYTLAIGCIEERPTGKWLTHQAGMLLWEECNQCRAQVGTIGMNYCPNCGARMLQENKL